MRTRPFPSPTRRNPVGAESARRGNAFTLIELLLVVTIMIVLLGMLVPAFNHLSQSFSLARGGQSIVDEMFLAKQTAITRNRNVEMRFIVLEESPSEKRWGLQTWLVAEDGLTEEPAHRLVELPESLTFDATRSPLLAGLATLSGTTNFAAHGSCEYVGFRFRPNGSTDLALAAATNGLLLRSAHASGDPPPNFFSILVNPLTGKVSAFRPN